MIDPRKDTRSECVHWAKMIELEVYRNVERYLFYGWGENTGESEGPMFCVILRSYFISREI